MVAGDTCGGISTLYTYPAWTFGGRHGSSKGPEGSPYYTAGNTGNGAHLKPGGPAYSFGARLPGKCVVWGGGAEQGMQ
eukprot:1157036-Pelagomonas_calceolata.AAC.3